MNHDKTNDEAGEPRARQLLRVAALIVIVMVTWYLYGVLTGELPENRRLDIVGAGIFVFGVLLLLVAIQPSLLGRLAKLRIGSLEIELSELVRHRTHGRTWTSVQKEGRSSQESQAESWEEGRKTTQAANPTILQLRRSPVYPQPREESGQEGRPGC